MEDNDWFSRKKYYIVVKRLKLDIDIVHLPRFWLLTWNECHPFCMETNEKNDYFDFFNEVDQDLWWSFKDADSSEEHEEMELALGSNKRQKLQKYRSYRFDNNKEITRAVPRHIKNYRTRHGLDHTRQTRDKRKPRQLASTPEAIELMYDSDESTIME